MSALAGVVPAEALGEEVDAARWRTLGGAPEAVVSPQSAEEAASLLRWASAEGVGVVPAGSGRRLGPRVVDGRYVVLSTDRLTGIEIYEPADVTLTALAGTRLRVIDEALRAHSQWLPFDPPSALDRTLGGLVAAGEPGPLATGYGSLRNHVLGLTVVTGDGRVLRLGGRVVKNVAGFDLLKPMVGSRGALAFIVSACLRAFPEPATERRLVLRAARPSELVGVALAVGTAPVMPVSCVVSARAGGSADLVVRLHGAEATVDADQRTLERHTGAAFRVEAAGGEEAGSEEAGSEEAGSEEAGGWDAGDSAETPGELVVSVLPSHLAAALTALERLAPAALVVDAYAGLLRARLPTLEPEGVRAARDEVEALGGGLRVARAPAGTSGAELGSRPSSGEEELAERLTRAFDPHAVLWRGER